MNSKNLYIVQAGVIAALYYVLTLVSSAMGLAFGPIQLRISEVLCILPVFTPAAVPGLAIGCVLANLASPYGIVDIIFGTVATLLAALCTRYLRHIKIKDLPVLSALMPVIFNALIIGLEIAILDAQGNARFMAFLTNALQIGIGELASAFALGLVFYRIVLKTNLQKLIKA